MSNTTTKQLPHEKSEWNGYTLEEIRYMRAYTAARMEITRDRLQRNFGNLKDYGPVSKPVFLARCLVRSAISTLPSSPTVSAAVHCAQCVSCVENADW